MPGSSREAEQAWAAVRTFCPVASSFLFALVKYDSISNANHVSPLTLSSWSLGPGFRPQPVWVCLRLESDPAAVCRPGLGCFSFLDHR